jgi:hypothetical protein
MADYSILNHGEHGKAAHAKLPISKAPAWCGSIRKRNWDSCGCMAD